MVREEIPEKSAFTPRFDLSRGEKGKIGNRRNSTYGILDERECGTVEHLKVSALQRGGGREQHPQGKALSHGRHFVFHSELQRHKRKCQM